MLKFNTVIIFKLPGHDSYVEESECAQVALSRLCKGIRFRENETDRKDVLSSSLQSSFE